MELDVSAFSCLAALTLVNGEANTDISLALGQSLVAVYIALIVQPVLQSTQTAPFK